MINDKINAICVNIFIINAKNEIFNTGNGNIRNKKKPLQINMISFSSITDSPKLNLDDVSDWYITNTIIKDPPKGITTRRIIKDW